MGEETARGPSPEEIEAGRVLFAQACTFLRGAARIEDLPALPLPEIAFAGRSNVGKSSLVNALTGRRTLARTSRTPGRTREINFFRLADRLILVDLPGYGFASAPKREIARWTALVGLYLKGRATLKRVVLLIDARRGIGDLDRDVMEMMDKAAVSYEIALTKCDKLRGEERARILDRTAAELVRRPAAYPHVAQTSALEGTGIPEFRAELAALAEPPRLG